MAETTYNYDSVGLTFQPRGYHYCTALPIVGGEQLDRWLPPAAGKQ